MRFPLARNEFCGPITIHLEEALAFIDECNRVHSEMRRLSAKPAIKNLVPDPG
jgi:hypothetical protein